MKKRLAYLFVIISIVVIVLYLFRYKRPLSIENKIPVTATEIVQIDLREIEHHLLIDAIKNPLKYLSFKTKSKKATTSLYSAIQIPRNLFFFTNKSSFKEAWFSSMIQLKDIAKLRSYLVQEGFNEMAADRLQMFNKGKIVIAVSDENVLIAYKKEQDHSVLTAIETIFKETGFHKKNAKILKSISNSKSDITYANLEADFLEADFKKGILEIKGKLDANLFIADTYPEYSKNSIGFLSTTINKNHSIFKALMSHKNKTKFREFTKLSIDSIAANWNGRVMFNLKSIDTEIDTIITFEYDDDFNKIKKKSVQQLNVPNAAVIVGSRMNLYEYLYANKTIKIVEEDTLFAGIPLYKMYAGIKENSLHIFSQKQFGNSSGKENRYRFKAHINIKKYLENPLDFSLIPIKSKYLQLVNKVSASLTINNELLIEVRLKDNNRNFMGQFIKP